MTDDLRIRQVADANRVSIAIARAAVTEATTRAGDNKEAQLIQVFAREYDRLSPTEAFYRSQDEGYSTTDPSEIRTAMAERAIRAAADGMNLSEAELGQLTNIATRIAVNHDGHGRNDR
jgi:hypothetical protein